MNTLEDIVDTLICMIKESRTFKEYERTKELLKQDAELKSKVDAYRAENYKLQNMEDDGHLGERIERFASDNAYLTDQVVVRQFLDAELALCRLLQEITGEIMDSIPLE